MPSIRITQFAGLMPDEQARLIPRTHAQIAHNCLLWDGALRPMPRWVQFRTLSLGQGDGHFYENPRTETIEEAYGMRDCVYLDGPPFPTDAIVGHSLEPLNVTGYKSNIAITENPLSAYSSYPAGLPTPTFAGANPSVLSYNIGYISTGFSQKPVNRVIGITFARQMAGGLQESTIAVIPSQSPYGIMFEGDIVEITLGLDMALLQQWGITHVRIYRTVPTLDSGEKAGNELDTDWHLLTTLKARTSVLFNDGGAATTDPMDLYLANEFYPPSFNIDHFGVSESGWFYAASGDGRVMVSERYLPHAWPIENRMDARTRITDMVTHFDNLYIGTIREPLIVALAPGEGEQGVQTGGTRYPARIPCLPGTMTVGPSGALYASPAGIVALSRQGQRVISAGLTNAGDVLYRETVPATEFDPAYRVNVQIKDTLAAAFHGGKYYGFVNGTSIDDPEMLVSRYGYVFDTGDEIHGQEKFQQLVTMDVPVGHIAHAETTSKGLTLKYMDDLFYLPLPSDGGELGYKRAPKSCYRWKSKKFVFPGNMTLAVGKIIHDCGGTVEIKLYVDCRCVWQASICDCQPFRIPSQIQGNVFEIEVSGKSPIQEIHLASSMRELLEQE